MRGDDGVGLEERLCQLRARRAPIQRQHGIDDALARSRIEVRARDRIELLDYRRGIEAMS